MRVGAKFFAVMVGLSLSLTSTFARQPEEAEFSAAERIGEDIAEWITSLERRPASIGIFSVYPNYPLDHDYSTIVETEILKSLAKNDFQNVLSCSECRANQVSLVNDRIVISKGAPDMEALKRIGKSQPVETFLMVELYRTKLSVMAHAVLYQNPSGVMISAERFRVSAISFSDASTQVILSLGLGIPISATPSTGFSTALNLSLLEELGFAKGGLVAGTNMGGSGTLLYLCPTLAFRGKFGRSYTGWALSVGAGYGMSGAATGIAFHGALDISLGSFAIVGGEFSYFLPGAAAAGILQGYAGFHVGIAIGR